MGRNLSPTVYLCILLKAADAGYGVSGFATPTTKASKASSTTSLLPVATIDAAELLDGPFYASGSAVVGDVRAIDGVLTRPSRDSAASVVVDRIARSGLTWTVLGAILSYSALSSRAMGTAAGLAGIFLTRYMALLEAAPLLTKCATGGLIALVGDYGAQWFEYRTSRGSRRRSTTSTVESDPALSLRAGGGGTPTALSAGRCSMRGTYDARRGAARFLECLLISSPMMHYGYDLFERIMPVSSVGGGGGAYRSLAALAHVFADCVFLDGIFVGTGILATGLLEGHSLRRRVLPNLRNVYLPTLRASIMTSGALVPLQFLSFRFLPVQLRVLSVNAVDLIWTGVVSFVSHGAGSEGARA